MLQLLAARESGLDPPWLLPKVHGSRLFSELQLSTSEEFSWSHTRAVNSLDLDRASGRYVISGGADINGMIVIHDTEKPIKCDRYKYPVVANVANAPTSCRNESHACSAVQWYPHDTGMFTTSSVDKAVRVWDTNEMVAVEQFKFTEPIYTHAMASASAHCLMAVGGRECKVTLCDISSGSATHILRSHRLPVMSLAWSPSNEHLLATGSQDNQILFWDVRKSSGPLLCLDQHNGDGSSHSAAVVSAHSGYVNALCFSSDGLFLVSFGTDNQLRLWDTCSGKNTLINYGRVVNAVSQQSCQLAITPHLTTLQPVLCVPSNSDIILFELLTGHKLKKLQGHFATVSCVSTHHLQQELYSGGADSNILAWTPPSLDARQKSLSRMRTGAAYEDSWSSDDD